MLNENDRRVLNAVFPEFIDSFDARNAAAFMELSNVFTPDEAERIENQKSSLSALRDFYRIYSRKADDLHILVNYLTSNLQQNLVESMNLIRSDFKDCNDQSPFRRHITREERHRILSRGQVPFPRNIVNRSRDVRRLADSLITKEEFREGFFVVLHGMAGVGKTTLISSVLAETELIGTQFDHVCFLTDGRTNPKDVKIIFYDLMVMLRDDLITPPPLEISDTALRKMILEALIDHPNLLVIIDDVTQEETVREAERLGLRVLATTRDRSIFDAVNSCVDIVPVEGFRLEETKDLMLRNGIKIDVDSHKNPEAISLAHAVTSGNPALLLKMAKLARGSSVILSNLANNIAKSGISAIDCTSSYRYRNLHVTFSDSVMRLTEGDRNALACASVVPADQWIPLDIWELVIPVDICEIGDVHDELRRQLRALHDNGFWVTESPDHEAFKVSAVVRNYLKETVDKNTIKECYSHLEEAFSTIQTANGCIDDRQNAIRNFLISNSTFFGYSYPK